MAAFLGNLRNVVIAGFVLAILLVGMYCSLQGFDAVVFTLFALRWLHVLCGVMWIGLLWYFNFVQIPTMPSIPADLKGGVTGYIAPKALFWFRWGAMGTILLGLLLAGHSAISSRLIRLAPMSPMGLQVSRFQKTSLSASACGWVRSCGSMSGF